jgi:uncharacterized protein (TIGR02452 family)
MNYLLFIFERKRNNSNNTIINKEMNLKEIATRNLKLVVNERIPISQKYTTEELKINTETKEHKEDTFLDIFNKKGTIGFLVAFSEDVTTMNNNNICILNFANKDAPGIKFPSSGRTQEEQLLRKFPNLFRSLTTINYPIASNEVIVTDYTALICDNSYKIIDEKKRKYAMFVTTPAPNHFTEPFTFELVLDKIKNSIIAPILFSKNNKRKPPDKLILGAWGCGAFLPPSGKSFGKILKTVPTEFQDCEVYQELIAKMFFHVLINLEYAKYYDEIIFAVPKLEPKDTNYDIFLNIFQNVVA